MDNIKDLHETFDDVQDTPVEPEGEGAMNPYDAALESIGAKLDRLIELVTEDKKVEDKVDRKENEIEKEGDEE